MFYQKTEHELSAAIKLQLISTRKIIYHEILVCPLNTIRNLQKENCIALYCHCDVPSASHIFIVRQNSVNLKQLDLYMCIVFCANASAFKAQCNRVAEMPHDTLKMPSP